MTQQTARPCPNCGTPLIPGQRFCSNCGVLMDDKRAGQATELTPPGPPSSFPTQTPTTQYTPPPPPTGGPGATYQSYQPPPPSSYQAPPETLQQPAPMPMQPPPNYAVRPKRDSSGSVLAQLGCGMILVVVLIVALCGGAAWFGWNWLVNSANSSDTGSNGGSSGSNNTRATQKIVNTVTMNEVITYSGTKLTFNKVEQANFFNDDSSTLNRNGAIRLYFHEENPGSSSGNYLYSDAFRLLLPDKTSVEPLRAKEGIGPNVGIARDNWVDFAVAQNVDVKQLVLRLGTTTQAQMDVPLTGSADLGKYQAKSVNVNKQTLYAGATWTITQATTTLSYQSKQADKDMMFVVVDVRIDNNSAKDLSAVPGDYIRLKTGSTTSEPTGSNTIPVTVVAGKTNQVGECAFLVPQGSSSFTLVLLAATYLSAQQAEIPFQV